MSKTLRLSFAMGGGVSLGSFSGAALTEILKLLFLYGQDSKGKPYDRIVLDSMSGSSAGAMSLAILLRSLMDYHAILVAIDQNWRLRGKELIKKDPTRKDKQPFPSEVPPEWLAYIDDRLEPHMSYLDTLISKRGEDEIQKRKETIRAIETAQLLQEILWVKEVSIQELFEGPIGTRKIEDDTFSLLKSDKLIELVESYLLPLEEWAPRQSRRQVLDQRVLFACSLTNLLPFKLNEPHYLVDSVKDKQKTYPVYIETQKALSSKTHKELRILDFWFEPIRQDASDTKFKGLHKTVKSWIPISYEGETIDSFESWKPGYAPPLQINSQEAWALVAATAIACGSFPIAFRPGILRRWKEEFPNWTENSDLANPQTDPDSMTSVWDLGIESFKFPYLDGGTLNNEPIREAFKLANYLDTRRKNVKEEEDFDRLVIFVDPIVDAKGHPTYNMDFYDPYQLKKRKVPRLNPFRQTYWEVENRGDVSKAISIAGKTVGLLRNQGSIKEEHKINNFLETVVLKKALEKHLSLLDINLTNQPDERDLFKKIFKHLSSKLKTSEIPYGTRELEEYFMWSVKRQIQKDIVFAQKIKQNKEGTESTKEEEITEKIHKLNDLLAVLKDSLYRPIPKAGAKQAVLQEQRDFPQRHYQAYNRDYEISKIFFRTLIQRVQIEDQKSPNFDLKAFLTHSASFKPDQESIQKLLDQQIISSEAAFYEDWQKTPLSLYLSQGIKGKDEKQVDTHEIEDIQEILVNVIKKAIFNMLIDAALDLDGKNIDAQRLSITPLAFQDYQKDALSADQLGEKQKKKTQEKTRLKVATIDLPGAELQAFGGFVSPETRAYSFTYGRYCALKVLSRSDFRNFYKYNFYPQDRKVGKKPFVATEYVEKNISKLEGELEEIYQEAEQNYASEVKGTLFSLVRDRLLKLVPTQFETLISFFLKGTVKGLPFYFYNGLIQTFIYLSLLLSLASLTQDTPGSFITRGTAWMLIFLIGILGLFYMIIRHRVNKGIRYMKNGMAHSINSISTKELSLKLNIPSTHCYDFYFFHVGDKRIKVKPAKDSTCVIKATWYKKSRAHGGEIYVLSRKFLDKNWKINPLAFYNQSELEVSNFFPVDSISFGKRRKLFRRKGKCPVPGKLYLSQLPEREGSDRCQEDLPLSIPLVANQKRTFKEGLEYFVQPVITCKFEEGKWSFDWEDATKTLEDMIWGGEHPSF